MIIELAEFLKESVIPLLIPMVVGYFAYFLFQSRGIALDEKHAKALSNSLQMGAELVVDKLDAKGKLAVEVESEAIAGIVKHAMDHTPDAIAHFKKSNPALDLERMSEARLALTKRVTASEPKNT